MAASKSLSTCITHLSSKGSYRSSLLGVNDFIEIFELFDLRADGFLGDGADAIVFKVIYKDTIKALKLIGSSYTSGGTEGADDDVDLNFPEIGPTNLTDLSDIHLGCKLVQLKEVTSSLIIPEAFGIFDRDVVRMIHDILYDLPNGELSQTIISKAGSLIGIVYPILKSNWDIKLSLSDRLAILFELLVALHSLHQIKIFHNDIHRGNILYEITDVCRQYEINGALYLVKCKYKPVIVDFGRSTEYWSLRELLDDHALLNKTMFVEDLPVSQREKIVYDKRNPLISPVFDFLKDNQPDGGETIRMFSPIEVDEFNNPFIQST